MLAIALVALALRIGLVIWTRHYGLTLDPADYQRYAASIALGHGYPPSGLGTPGTASAFRPPAYPYLLGGIYALFGIHPTLGRLLSALLGVVTVLLVAQLGATLWDRRVGLLAGAIAAVCPSLITLTGSLLSESLFLPLELALALCPASWRLARDYYASPRRRHMRSGHVSATARPCSTLTMRSFLSRAC